MVHVLGGVSVGRGHALFQSLPNHESNHPVDVCQRAEESVVGAVLQLLSFLPHHHASLSFTMSVDTIDSESNG
jgi:hypothetical protein